MSNQDQRNIADDSVTEDFCEVFKTKQDCTGGMAWIIPLELPEGVNPNDPRVIQIVKWCNENKINR